MALFQPSNVIPSTFSGFENQTVNGDKEAIISWQVNGNSAMTAFAIVFYDTLGNQLAEISKITLDTPFYGIDNKGNPQQFTYDTGKVWATLVPNENTVQMVITQYWKEGTVEKSITQYSGSIFYVSSVSSLLITFTPALDSSGKGTVAKQGFSASFEQQYTPEVLVNSVRWQFASVDDDGTKTILDDTGMINTAVLSYEYAGLFNGKKYAIKCDIETTYGLSGTSDWQEFEVSYEEAEVSASNKITMQPLADDSVLLSWQGAKNIEGTLSPSGTPTLDNGMLNLADGQSVLWDKVDNVSGLNITSPYTVGWKGKLAKTNIETVEITAKPDITSEKATLTTTKDDFVAVGSIKEEYFETAFGSIVAMNALSINENGVGIAPHNTNFSYGWTKSIYKVDFIAKTAKSIDMDEIIYGTAYGNGLFCAFGESSCYVSSDNCETWEKSTTMNDKIKTVPSIGGVAACFSNGKFVYAIQKDIDNSAVNSRHQVFLYTAENPLGKWTEIKTNIVNTDFNNGFNSFFTANNVLFALSAGNDLYVSDKNDWTSFNFSSLGDKLSTIPYCVYCNGIYFMNGGYYSSDLISWEKTDFSYTNYGVAVSKNTFILGSDDFYISRDGKEWTALGLKSSSKSLYAYVHNYFNGTFYLCIEYSGTSTRNYFSITELYTHTETIANNKWVKSYSVLTVDDNIVSASVKQTDVSSFDLLITTKGYGVSVDFGLTYASEYSNGSTALTFDKGTLSGVEVVSTSPYIKTTATVSKSDNNITVNVKTPTDLTTLQEIVSVMLLEVYDDWATTDFMTTDKYKFNIVKKVLSDGLNGYSLQLYDITSSSTIAQTGYVNIPTTSETTTVYGIVVFNSGELSLYLVDEKGLYSYSKTNITITQQDLASLTLNGEQLCDWVYISDTDETITATFTPTWNINTQFLADFLTQNDALQAGTATNSTSLANALYRQGENSETLDLIMELPTKYNQLKDYGLCSNQEYSYEIFYQNGDYAYSKPIKSEKVCRQYTAYTLIEAVQDSDYANVYHAKQVWRFGNNLSAGSISNNNTPNWLTNFTAYRLRQPTARLGQSGTLQALLANYNQDENFYRDTLKLADELKTASTRTNTFFLKDMKGNIYMVGISGAITQTIDTKSKVQEITVSVPWEEVGDASNVMIIQLPDDEGWAKDGVMGVVLNVSQADGKLSASYKSNYYGTTFALSNANLKTSTPADVNGQVNVSLKNGEVKATKES